MPSLPHLSGAEVVCMLLNVSVRYAPSIAEIPDAVRCASTS